ncbi:proteasome regulatory particle lid subunit [Maudiozyma humilis]|uniref:26S proteasome complex subunit SEM1 n=1 Tax=Maudiozyma humilis TaxID=51915 RepID=A0AAV5S7M0_MAUHU|nr:proteasome regulatory particle lid subunit [Kazachstania humilis]
MSSTTEKAVAMSKEDTVSKESPAASNRKSLEEDDEFEDFPADQWPAGTSLKDTNEFHTNLWEESWDDVEVDDNFTNDLRAEISRYKQEHQA